MSWQSNPPPSYKAVASIPGGRSGALFPVGSTLTKGSALSGRVFWLIEATKGTKMGKSTRNTYPQEKRSQRLQKFKETPAKIRGAGDDEPGALGSQPSKPPAPRPSQAMGKAFRPFDTNPRTLTREPSLSGFPSARFSHKFAVRNAKQHSHPKSTRGCIYLKRTINVQRSFTIPTLSKKRLIA